MQKLPFNLILLGDPASGKGTQAERLALRFKLYDFDMGAEVRKPAAKRLYNYKETTAKGKLTPTHVVRKTLRRVIYAVPSNKGILFNGHPKMIGEAKLAAGWLKQRGRRDPLVIYLSIPFAEILRRAQARRIYIEGKFKKRDDDSLQALQNRRRYYREQVSQVVKFFKKKYKFVTVSGKGSQDEVWKRLSVIVARYEKNVNDKKSGRN